MPVVLRNFKQILVDWLSYTVGHSALTDVNPGSVVRTIGEATALEMAQGYVQLLAVLNLFSIDKASGDDLDERVADFGLTREQPTKSVGFVNISDSLIPPASVLATALALGANPADTSLTILVGGSYPSFSSWPSTGVVVIERDNASAVEYLTYTSTTAPNILNLSTPVTKVHPAGRDVIKSTAGSNRTIPSGMAVSSTTNPPVAFKTTEDGILYDGEYTVQIPVESDETGSATNVAANTLTILPVVPFGTATADNLSPTKDGGDLETDDTLRARTKNYWQSLSNVGTRASIENTALTTSIPTGERVISALLVEPVAPGESLLYIHDGSNPYAPSTADVNETELLVLDAQVNTTRGALANWPVKPSSLLLFSSIKVGVTPACGIPTSIVGQVVSVSGATWTPGGLTSFIYVDGDGKTFGILSNTANTLTLDGLGADPISFAIIDPATPLATPADYVINLTNGQLELTVGSFPTGLPLHDALLAYWDTITPAYQYYDGLLQEVQKRINGDPKDIVTYPGVIAAGTKVAITAPTTLNVLFTLNVTALDGYSELTLYLPVKQAVVGYVNSLGIGDDVLLSQVISAALGITGVKDVTVLSPTGNVPVGPSQIAKTSVANITVL